TGTLTFAGAGAALDSSFGSLILTTNNPVALNADFTFSGSNALNLGTGAVTLGTASTATSTTRTITVNSNVLTIGGVIGNSGSTMGLAKAGNNTLLLNAQNTYTGNTAVTNGTLRIGTNNAIAAGNSLALFAGQTIFGNGAAPTFDLNGFNQSLGSITMGSLQNNVGSTITNTNVASTSTLTLTGGATALTLAVPLSGSSTGASTISTNYVDLAGAAQTFNIYDGSGNPDLNITSIVQNGSIVKANGGQMALQGPNTYTGTTSIFGGQLQVSSNLGSINQSTGLVVGGGGTLVVTNAANQTGIDRLKNTAGITSYGGGLQFSNTASQGVVYAETLGTLTASAGQFDTYLVNNMSSGAGSSGPTNSQTLTLGGLAQSGTAVVTFSANTTQPNATTNVIAVSGATQTTAGQIIGPWATTGVDTGNQQDYAAYNAAGQIVPAAIADSAETTWTNAANAYTMG
ncbi:MAG: hypothetical protein EBR23_13005, partial [Planctomycetia bacterium]|nr:hypothetical protein [Planctomycetia bacterium]